MARFGLENIDRDFFWELVDEGYGEWLEYGPDCRGCSPGASGGDPSSAPGIVYGFPGRRRVRHDRPSGDGVRSLPEEELIPAAAAEKPAGTEKQTLAGRPRRGRNGPLGFLFPRFPDAA